MASEPPKNVAIERSAHTAFKASLGNSRELNGALSNTLRWIARQDSDIRGIIYDGVSPDLEVRILELLLERARKRLDDGEPIGGSATLGTPGGRGKRITA